MPQLSVHDVPWETYHLVDVPEKQGERFVWKELELPGIRIVLFPEPRIITEAV